MYYLLYRVISIFSMRYRCSALRGHGFKSRTGLNFFQALFSLLLKQFPYCRKIAFVFTSLSAIQIYDFHISTVVYSPLHRFIWNQHNYQLPVGLLVQLVERCTGIPYRPEFFLRPYFHYCSSSVPYCEDCFHIHNYFPLELCYKYTTFT